MKKSETLSWILDKEIEHPKGFISILVDNDASREYRRLLEQERQRNIAFVHSLGQKCDSVGWSVLDLTYPDADDILDAIKKFCVKNNYKARGCYSYTPEEMESEWYLLHGRYFSNGEWDYADIVSQNGSRFRISELIAYKIPKGTVAIWDERLPHVSETFVKACKDNNLTGIDFYWLRDIGKYNSTQFFNVIPKNRVPWIACERYLGYTEKEGYHNTQDHAKGSPLFKRFCEIGGKLPKLSEIFYNLSVNLPDYFPKDKMPSSGFAYAYYYHPAFSRQNLLIHKDYVNILLKEGAISEKYITPALICDKVPKGYYIQHTEELPVPEKNYLMQLSQDYTSFLQTPRPIRKATEKQALGLLRKAKRNRKNEFGKKLSAKTVSLVASDSYARIVPYYLVADGGVISDEYHFLSYEESLKETEQFFVALKTEELVDTNLDGVVFAHCADGDTVVLRNNGKVSRISHEVPEVIEQWDTLAQFFYDCTNSE